MDRAVDTSSISPWRMAKGAHDAVALMKALSSEHRLLILCHLISQDEMPVNELVSKIGLSQSALSQHLAKLRAEGLVTFRREAQTLFYRVSDDRAANVLLLLQELFCQTGNGVLRKSRMAPRRQPRNKSARGV